MYEYNHFAFGIYTVSCLWSLGLDTVQFGKQKPRFRRNLLSPYSAWNTNCKKNIYTIQLMAVTESMVECFFANTWQWLRASSISFMRYRKLVGLSNQNLVHSCINDTRDLVEQTPLLFSAISLVRQTRNKWGQWCLQFYVCNMSASQRRFL
jgi:hypothetical protein